MAQKIRERCIYCGGEILFDESSDVVKCDYCGNNMVITAFESEMARIRAALEEGETAKRNLKAAETEKKELQDRVNEAVSSLHAIESVEKKQSAVFVILQSLAAGQAGAGEQLKTLRDSARQILDSQEDLAASLRMQADVLERLRASGMEAERCRQLMTEFSDWCRESHEDDLARLKKLDADTGRLLEEQLAMDRKMDMLQRQADDAREALREFHDQYRQDRLNELRELYHQAENYQFDHSYEKAEEYYQKVISRGGRDAEVCWRLLLCHYCVSYQKDEEGTYIPILLNPDLTAPEDMSVRREYALAVREAGRDEHARELERIDRILEKYRLLAGKETYDIFLSVKQNRDGRYTPDSDVASDLYDFLTEKGFRVFNSRRTRIPAGQEYEPYIISALMSAKIMIVVGTSRENMESQWVKNEWFRFQWLMKKEEDRGIRGGRLLLCYLSDGMRPHEIPRGLNPARQAIVNGIKAHDELLDAVYSIFPAKRKDTTVPQAPETPERPDTPATPENPVTPDRPEAPESPQRPGTQEQPTPPQSPDPTQQPDTPQDPGIPEGPDPGGNRGTPPVRKTLKDKILPTAAAVCVLVMGLLTVDYIRNGPSNPLGGAGSSKSAVSTEAQTAAGSSPVEAAEEAAEVEEVAEAEEAAAEEAAAEELPSADSATVVPEGEEVYNWYVTPASYYAAGLEDGIGVWGGPWKEGREPLLQLEEDTMFSVTQIFTDEYGTEWGYTTVSGVTGWVDLSEVSPAQMNSRHSRSS